MRVSLYPEQEDALEKLKTGSILVGGVGSGKSIVSLAYFYNKVCGGDYKKMSPLLYPRSLYIITTAKKRNTLEWEEECARFSLSTDISVSVSGISVKVDSWNNIKKYNDITNAFFIFDEQRVVGSGVWVNSFLKITKHNDWILLSATPGDTWYDYIPVFMANGFYRTRTEFLRQHAVFNRYSKWPKIDRYVDTDILERYRKNIVVIMGDNRKTKRHIIDVRVDYQKDIYNTAVKDRWNPIQDTAIRDAGELCHILRRIVNSDDSRLEAVIRLSKKHDRLIVFYNLDCELEKLLSLKDIPDMADFVIAQYNGHKHESTPTSEKWLYLVQYSAGAEGWNCVTTNTVVLYSLNYSYRITEQACGRIDRLNTPYTDLLYYRLISRASIDSGILSALRYKRTFNESAFARKT